MSKKVKMVLQGEPGVGKSVFACGAPKPFFICTDGNYEWLTDFGAKEEDHINVSSWSQAKKAFSMDFSNYATIVVDLTEDLFKWCEQEFCKRNGFEHISDCGFGKGYDITRNEFIDEVGKLIALDKNIIFIMHGRTTTEKDRRGIEHTFYYPTSRIPDKVLDAIEGKVRYFLRCYLKAEEQPDGTIIKSRWLSVVPKECERYCIARGINENSVPHDIPLSWTDFAKVIGIVNAKGAKPNEAKAIVKPVEKKTEVKTEEVEEIVETDEDYPTEPLPEPIPAKAETKSEVIAACEEVISTPNVEDSHEETNEEKMARIMAKLKGNK